MFEGSQVLHSLKDESSTELSLLLFSSFPRENNAAKETCQRQEINNAAGRVAQSRGKVDHRCSDPTWSRPIDVPSPFFPFGSSSRFHSSVAFVGPRMDVTRDEMSSTIREPHIFTPLRLIAGETPPETFSCRQVKSQPTEGERGH